MVEDENELKLAIDLWNQANPGMEQYINFEGIAHGEMGKVYKITPEIVKFFNEELYGPEGIETFTF